MGMIQFSLSNRANQSEFCMDFACIYPISSFFIDNESITIFQ